MSIAANIAQIQQNTKTYGAVRLIAVSKNRSLAEILAAVDAGIEEVGENRVAEAETKLPFLPSRIKKHLIGHLQTNKAKRAVALFDMIQSVDSLSLAEKINAECAKIDKVMPVLLQVNIARDSAKHGFFAEELMREEGGKPVPTELSKKIAQLSHLKICGLMTIPKAEESAEETAKHFANLRDLFKKIAQTKLFGTDFQELSMGMSDDYKIALAAGATMIRVGSRIFSA